MPKPPTWTHQVIAYLRPRPDVALSAAEIERAVGTPSGAQPVDYRLEMMARAGNLRRDRDGAEVRYRINVNGQGLAVSVRPAFELVGRGGPRVASVFHLGGVL